MPPLKLEVFETARDRSDRSALVNDADLEETRLAAYEQGYAAGWDDAADAQAEDQRSLRADLARNLQGMSFTYHEARAHLLRAVGPLLQDLTIRLLPPLMREALAPVVLDTLMPLVENAADAPVVIVLNPAARPAVAALLDASAGLPVSFREEPSLGEGQAFLELGETETRIDLDRASSDILSAVRGFFELAERERKHG